jgi:hypothetical protein
VRDCLDIKARFAMKRLKCVLVAILVKSVSCLAA